MYLFLSLSSPQLTVLEQCRSNESFMFHRIYEMEKRVQTPAKYLIPHYESLHWYAAGHFLDYLTGTYLTEVFFFCDNLSCWEHWSYIANHFLLLSISDCHYLSLRYVCTAFVRKLISHALYWFFEDEYHNELVCSFV